MNTFRNLILETLSSFIENKSMIAEKSLVTESNAIIKASGNKMAKFANDDYYIYKFEQENNGKLRPLFVPSEYKSEAKIFNSESEAKTALDQAIKDFPIYMKLFDNYDIESLDNE